MSTKTATSTFTVSVPDIGSTVETTDHLVETDMCAIYNEDFRVYCWYSRNVIANLSKRV